MPTATELGYRARALRAPALQLLGIAVGGVALQLTPVGAAAQKLRTELSLESQLAASDNAGRAVASQARSDLILDLRPSVRVTSRGSGLNLDMKAGLVSRTYIQGTQKNRVEPDVDMRGRATLVEGWVALDGSVRVSSASVDPLDSAAGLNGDLTADSFRQSRVNITPRIQRELSPELQLQAYSSNSWQRREDPEAPAAERKAVRTENTAARLARRAVPLGALVEVKRQRQNNPASVTADTVLAIDAVRVGAAYRVLPQLTAGATVGREHSVYRDRNDRDSTVGFNVEWQPNERAWLRSATEKRFFGQGYDVGMGYRSPFLAISGTWSRQPGSAVEPAVAMAPGNDVSALLDSLLTTRIPDPIDRATAVNRLVAERGLPARLSEPADLFAATPQLVSNGALNLVLLGVRHTVAASLFTRSTRDLRRLGELSAGANPTDIRQRGGSMVFSRRLTPTASLSATLQQTVTESLASRAGETLRESRAQAELGMSLNSRTRLSVGLGRQILKSSRLAKRSESRASVGLLQNF